MNLTVNLISVSILAVVAGGRDDDDPRVNQRARGATDWIVLVGITVHRLKDGKQGIGVRANAIDVMRSFSLAPAGAALRLTPPAPGRVP